MAERKDRQTRYVDQLKPNLPAGNQEMPFPRWGGVSVYKSEGSKWPESEISLWLGSKIILLPGLGVSRWLGSVCSQDHE